MRVSTAMIFNTGTSGLQSRQYDLYKLQQQLSTGRRVLTPADDPIAASEALQVAQSSSVNQQYMDNQGNAKTDLNFLDTILGSVIDQLQSVKESAVQAGNSTYSPAQRGMIAEELKRRQDSLLALGNTQDGTGSYLFAGFQSTTKPFEENTNRTRTGTPLSYRLGLGTYINYKGDSGQHSVQVSASQVTATTENGMNVFMQVKDSSGNVVSRSLFDGLQNLIDILDPASGVPYDTSAYTQAMGDLTSAIDHVSTIRASVAARLQTVSSLATASDDISYQYTSRLSELQDLDYNAAISSFANYKMQLDAAQLSFKQISQLSLFNIL